jgi:DNA-binding transcriptional ArsR family regulator
MKRRVPELHYRSSRIFRVLGNPTAYQIIKSLAKGKKKPSEIAAELKLSPPTVSTTLRNLRQLDLVRYENLKDGKVYFIKDEIIISVLEKVELLVERIKTREY